MKTDIIKRLNKSFEESAFEENGVEYVKIRGTNEDLAKTAEGKLVLIPE